MLKHKRICNYSKYSVCIIMHPSEKCKTKRKENRWKNSILTYLNDPWMLKNCQKLLFLSTKTKCGTYKEEKIVTHHIEIVEICMQIYFYLSLIFYLCVFSLFRSEAWNKVCNVFLYFFFKNDILKYTSENYLILWQIHYNSYAKFYNYYYFFCNSKIIKDTDVKCWMGKATAVFQQMCSVWTMSTINTAIKIKLFNAIIIPTAVYSMPVRPVNLQELFRRSTFSNNVASEGFFISCMGLCHKQENSIKR